MPYIDHIVADILYTQIDSESEKSDHSIARCACTLLTTQNNGTVAVKTTGPCDVIVHRTGEDERHFLIIFQNICLHLPISAQATTHRESTIATSAVFIVINATKRCFTGAKKNGANKFD